MVSGVSSSLTRLGFRRDVRIFLSVLVGYLIVVLLSLLLTLQSAVIGNRQLVADNHQALASELADQLEDMDPSAPRAIRDELDRYRLRFGLVRIELDVQGPELIASGFAPLDKGLPIERETALGRLTLYADDSINRSDERRFRMMALITLISVSLVTLLLLLYVRRILRPIEAMLDQAAELEVHPSGADEAHFLVATFEQSVQTLKAQKRELEILHERERLRANDLERVTTTLKRSLSSGLLATDADDRIVDINSAAREVLAIDDASAVIGKTVAEVLVPGEFTTALGDSIAHRTGVARLETTHRTERGEIAVGLTTVALLDEDKSFVGMLALFNDLTPIRSLESRIRDLQTLADLGEISAGIAHEFRNSLSTVLGHLNLARRATPGTPAARNIEMASEEATHLARAVDGLLAFARPMSIEFHSVQLDELLQNAVTRARVEHPGIEYVMAMGVCSIQGDEALLRRVFENLLRNAAESILEMGTHGRIEVVVRGREQATITICDNGVGLDPDQAAKSFLPFQSGKPGGFGLGLALARKIVLLHEGTIQLTGRPREGATVVVKLPRTGAHAD